MARQREVLLVDAGAQPMALLAARLRRLDFRVYVAKTSEEAHYALVDPRRDVGALVIPPDLPVSDLAGALKALRRLAASEDLPILTAGQRPSPESRRGLRMAGVETALWEPTDAHTLRFQVNRALAGPIAVRRERGAPRVPVAWAVWVVRGRRSLPARLYSLSTSGAFIATERPALRGSALGLMLELPAGRARLAGRVVMTNVPGNLARRNLPTGMGVCFDAQEADTEAALHLAIEERARDLAL